MYNTYLCRSIYIHISGTVIQICLEFDYVLKQPRQPLFDQSLAEKRQKKSEYALFLVHYQLHISEFMILPPLKNSNIVVCGWPHGPQLWSVCSSALYIGMYIAALKTKIVPECKKIAQVSSYADDDGNNNGVSVPVCLCSVPSWNHHYVRLCEYNAH